MSGDTNLMEYTKGQGLTPANLGEALKLAEMLADSSFVPATNKGKPGDIIAAIQMGSEVGLKPMSALQSIAVINGRPSIFGDGYLGLLLASPVYEKHEEAYSGSGASRRATCTMWRRGNPTPFVGTFGYADAQTAGYLGKDTYKQHPDRMYMWRARHAVGQAGFADVTKGLLPAEVAEDYPLVVVESKVKAPERKSAPAEPAPEQPAPTTAPQTAQAARPAPPAAPTGSKITDPQRKRFYAIYKHAGMEDDAVKAYLKQTYGIEHTADITRDIYEAVCAWAERGGVEEPPAEPGSNG